MKIAPWKRPRLERALERRFGKSMLHYEIVQEPDELSFQCKALDRWRCSDPETGSFIIGKFEGDRLRIIAEHDGGKN